MWQLYWEDTDTPTRRAHPQDPMLWFGQLTPTYHADEDTWYYSCGHYSEDEDNKGVCGIYDTRPEMCANFPYGKPKRYEGCAYDVELVDFEVVH